MANESSMITHAVEPPDLEAVVSAARARIVAAGDLPHVTVDEQLALLEGLTEFPMGRFMLVNRGWNGWFTGFAVVYHPTVGREKGADESGRPYTALERRMLELPLCRATQERFVVFQRALQARVRDGARLGSLPCGLMDDLLSLDFSGVGEFELVGIDLDAESLRQAAANAERRGLFSRAAFRREDGWDRGDDELDVLTSNGLNTYEPDDARVVALYRAFRHRIRKGGTLVTSALTTADEWDGTAIDADEARLQRILFADVIGVRFSCLRTEAQTRAQLGEAGFEVEDVTYDRARLFPTFVAKRR